VAEALGHKMGQIIGDMFEAAMKELLVPLAERYGVYLDFSHPRPARAKRTRVVWQDREGNKHLLDYVFERGGSETTIGSPAAFVETAWRRYTKHAKNKVQEIDAAVTPLAEAYGSFRPFLGAVLGGDFTENSLTQLRSRGFSVLYISYPQVVSAFREVGIDMSYNEETTDAEFSAKIRDLRALGDEQLTIVKSKLLLEQPAAAAFVGQLEESLGRSAVRVQVTALHGDTVELASVADAIAYITEYPTGGGTASPATRFEVTAHFSNGDTIVGSFGNQPDALAFLRGLGPA